VDFDGGEYDVGEWGKGLASFKVVDEEWEVGRNLYSGGKFLPMVGGV
jgi:hypothetical protein